MKITNFTEPIEGERIFKASPSKGGVHPAQTLVIRFVIIMVANSDQEHFYIREQIATLLFRLCHVCVYWVNNKAVHLSMRSLYWAELKKLAKERSQDAAAASRLLMASSQMSWWIKPVLSGQRLYIAHTTAAGGGSMTTDTGDCYSACCTTALFICSALIYSEA